MPFSSSLVHNRNELYSDLDNLKLVLQFVKETEVINLFQLIFSENPDVARKLISNLYENEIGNIFHIIVKKKYNELLSLIINILAFDKNDKFLKAMLRDFDSKENTPFMRAYRNSSFALKKKKQIDSAENQRLYLQTSKLTNKILNLIFTRDHEQLMAILIWAVENDYSDLVTSIVDLDKKIKYQLAMKFLFLFITNKNIQENIILVALRNKNFKIVEILLCFIPKYLSIDNDNELDIDLLRELLLTAVDLRKKNITITIVKLLNKKSFYEIFFTLVDEEKHTVINNIINKCNNLEIVEEVFNNAVKHDYIKFMLQVMDEEFNTALLCAVKNSNFDIVKAILDFADIHNFLRQTLFVAEASSGRTALIIAVQENNIEITKLILDRLLLLYNHEQQNIKVLEFIFAVDSEKFDVIFDSIISRRYIILEEILKTAMHNDKIMQILFTKQYANYNKNSILMLSLIMKDSTAIDILYKYLDIFCSSVRNADIMSKIMNVKNSSGEDIVSLESTIRLFDLRKKYDFFPKKRSIIPNKIRANIRVKLR